MATNLQRTIDALGVVRGQIEELKKREQELRDIIASFGEGIYEGEEYSATVSVFLRENLDLEAVRRKLSPQWLRAHTLRQTIKNVRVEAL